MQIYFNLSNPDSSSAKFILETRLKTLSVSKKTSKNEGPKKTLRNPKNPKGKPETP